MILYKIYFYSWLKCKFMQKIKISLKKWHNFNAKYKKQIIIINCFDGIDMSNEIYIRALNTKKLLLSSNWI